MKTRGRSTTSTSLRIRQWLVIKGDITARAVKTKTPKSGRRGRDAHGNEARSVLTKIIASLIKSFSIVGNLALDQKAQAPMKTKAVTVLKITRMQSL
jgi:hypothetical protein